MSRLFMGSEHAEIINLLFMLCQTGTFTLNGGPFIKLLTVVMVLKNDGLNTVIPTLVAL